MPVVEIVRPEGAGFECGVIKPGHTLIMVNDRSLLSLPMRESAKIIAEAADKVKSSQGRVPCVFRFLKTDVVDGSGANEASPPASTNASGASEAVEKKPSLMSRCLPKLFSSRRKSGASASKS